MNIKKLLIFGILGLVLVGGAGGGAYYFLFLKKGDGEHAGAEEEKHEDWHAEAEAPKAPAPKPAQQPQTPSYIEEDADEESDVKIAANQTHIINLPTVQGGSRNVYLKCQISIIVIDEELGNAMKSPAPTYESEKSKSIVRETLNELSAEEISDPDTQEIFKQDIKDKLNEQFRPRPSSSAAAKPSKESKGHGGGHGGGKEAESTGPRPLRPIKEVLIIEWQIQR